MAIEPRLRTRKRTGLPPMPKSFACEPLESRINRYPTRPGVVCSAPSSSRPQEPPLAPCTSWNLFTRSKFSCTVVVASARLHELSGHARAVVSHSIDRAVIVVGDQHRAVLEDHEVSRAPDIIVVFNEARDERIDGFHRTVLVEGHHDDVAAELLGSIPRAVARDEDGIAVFRREHVAGVEPHAERG